MPSNPYLNPNPRFASWRSGCLLLKVPEILTRWFLGRPHCERQEVGRPHVARLERGFGHIQSVPFQPQGNLC